MYNYLSSKTADYTTASFSVTPQIVMPITGDKMQTVHQYDDGSVSVITASNQSYFDVELQWNYINSTDRATIMSFWHTSTKANGRENTFYWLNPVDSKYYTVRFMSPLIQKFKPGSIVSIDSIRLRVEGNKPT